MNQYVLPTIFKWGISGMKKSAKTLDTDGIVAEVAYIGSQDCFSPFSKSVMAIASKYGIHPSRDKRNDISSCFHLLILGGYQNVDKFLLEVRKLPNVEKASACRICGIPLISKV